MFKFGDSDIDDKARCDSERVVETTGLRKAENAGALSPLKMTVLTRRDERNIERRASNK